MKKTVIAVLAVMLCGLYACGGGGDATPAGEAPPVENAMSDADAMTTAKTISSVAMAVLQKIGGGAPAGMVITKKGLSDIKSSASLDTTVTGRNGGSCSASVSGTVNDVSDPMTFSISGTLTCDSFSDSVEVDGVMHDVVLSGSITENVDGSIAQDYSSIDVLYALSWTALSAIIDSTSFAAIEGNYTLNITGSLGTLTFVENGTIDGKTISSTYTFESDLPEEPAPPPDDTLPTDDGSTPEDNLDDTIAATSILVIFAQDGQFLGVVNDNRFDSDSICNGFGSYGSKYSATSIWNKYGTYGSDYQTKSAFDDYTSTPPILYEYNGYDLIPWYYVTTNTIKMPRIDSFALLALLQSYGCDIER